ncbi:MAG: hypothetical protein CL916_02685 [Deltaproteobacteria bacterium]|nr:hypothetical protein [Deltaproteobacteria bacterium]
MYPLHVVFSIGHKITGIGMYFNQSKMVRVLHSYPHEGIQKMELDWIDHLKRISEVFAKAVLELNQILDNMGKETAETPPQTPEEYLVWANGNHQWFMNHLPNKTIARAIYLYGFAVGEMMSTLTTCSCALDISIQQDISMSEQLVHNQKIIIALLERWEILARRLGEIEPLSFLRRHFLSIASPIEAIVIDGFEHLSKEEQIEKKKKIRQKIDQLGILEEECRALLLAIDEQSTSTSESSAED